MLQLARLKKQNSTAFGLDSHTPFSSHLILTSHPLRPRYIDYFNLSAFCCFTLIHTPATSTVFTTCLLPRNTPSEYGLSCHHHTTTHVFDSASLLLAVPVTSVSFPFLLVSVTDRQRGRLSRRVCPSRNTAIQGRQHRQLPQLVPQSIFTARRDSPKCSPARCIRN